MNYTVELAKILRDPAAFPWGKLEQVHRIDVYTVLEYQPWRADEATGALLVGSVVPGARLFAVYVGDVDTRRSADSLDYALLLAMAWRHEGAHSAAGEMAARLFGLSQNPRHARR